MGSSIKSMKLHIGIFGRRNAGKSSFLNRITAQDVSIVSDIAGTTTDIVEKSMELLPIGPVVFIDTAGIDDEGELGGLRIEKTLSAIERVDIGIIVCTFEGFSNFEKDLIKTFKELNKKFIVVINKSDIQKITQDKLEEIKSYTNEIIEISVKNNFDIDKIKGLIAKNIPENFLEKEFLLDDLLKKGDTVVFVTPVDKEAPKGRLILPQVQSIRNALDNGIVSVVLQVDELKNAINNMKNLPNLVVTDSQAFKEVNEIVEDKIPLTSFSILFARMKGDLKEFVKSAKTIENLNDGDKILICETCTHHPICEDIGRVKIPRLLKNYTKKEFIFDVFSGHDFPKNLTDYKLIIHCGGCMINRAEFMSRIFFAKKYNVPITNYGVVISYCLSIMEKATEMFEL